MLRALRGKMLRQPTTMADNILHHRQKIRASSLFDGKTTLTTSKIYIDLLLCNLAFTFLFKYSKQIFLPFYEVLYSLTTILYNSNGDSGLQKVCYPYPVQSHPQKKVFSDASLRTALDLQFAFAKI